VERPGAQDSHGELSAVGTDQRAGVHRRLLHAAVEQRNSGGTCFGDSGGPNFIGTSNVIGGVTSFARNGNCAGTGGVYRVDRFDDLAWLANFDVFPPLP